MAERAAKQKGTPLGGLWTQEWKDEAPELWKEVVAARAEVDRLHRTKKSPRTDVAAVDKNIAEITSRVEDKIALRFQAHTRAKAKTARAPNTTAMASAPAVGAGISSEAGAIPPPEEGAGGTLVSRSDLQAMFNIAVAAAANHVRPAPLAIEDGSERLTRMEDKLDAVRDAAVQSMVDNAEEHGLEELAAEKMIEKDDGTLEKKAIEKMIEDDDGDLENQAIQKLTREKRTLVRRQKRRIEGLDVVVKRMRTEAKTAPMPGEVISALLANEQWRQEVVAQVTADVTGGEVVSALLADGQWRQETIAQVVDDETAREEMIDALAVSHRAQVREELELDSQEDSELEADEVDE